MDVPAGVVDEMLERWAADTSGLVANLVSAEGVVLASTRVSSWSVGSRSLATDLSFPLAERAGRAVGVELVRAGRSLGVLVLSSPVLVDSTVGVDVSVRLVFS